MNIAVVLTGGTGSRLKRDFPKQFIEIDGCPLFIRTLENILSVPEIGRVLLVINSDFCNRYEDLLAKFDLSDRVERVEGGSTRQESVEKALKYLSTSCSENDIVLIHDGARPFVDREIIGKNLDICALKKEPVSTVLPITDTLIDAEYTLYEREKMFLVQTPQTFPFAMILEFHRLAQERGWTSLSDDAQLAALCGRKVHFVEGSRFNIKVTKPEDLKLAALFGKIR